jgi:hypothetical protein
MHETGLYITKRCNGLIRLSRYDACSVGRYISQAGSRSKGFVLCSQVRIPCLWSNRSSASALLAVRVTTTYDFLGRVFTAHTRCYLSYRHGTVQIQFTMYTTCAW